MLNFLPDLNTQNSGHYPAQTEPEFVAQYGTKPNSEFTTGILFIKTKNANNEEIFAYYHHDHLNTPIQTTDKAGNVVWSAMYHPFGRVKLTTPPPTQNQPTITSNLRYPGQYEDEETGLYYNWNRYYDPDTGRYITQDPIGLEGGINLYAYVGGNPLNFIDPTGEMGKRPSENLASKTENCPDPDPRIDKCTQDPETIKPCAAQCQDVPSCQQCCHAQAAKLMMETKDPWVVGLRYITECTRTCSKLLEDQRY